MDILKSGLNFSAISRSMCRSVRLMVPTSGMTEVKTGSASGTQSAAYMGVATGATAESVGIMYYLLIGWAGVGGAATKPNLAKRTTIRFVIYPTYSVANAVRYWHIKEANTHGDLAAIGLGLKLVNLTLYGESYGSERGAVELMTLESVKEYPITIEHDPVGGSIKWYVGGVLKGEQSTPAAIPNASFSTAGRFVLSITNGATASDAQLYTTPAEGIQEA